MIGKQCQTLPSWCEPKFIAFETPRFHILPRMDELCNPIECVASEVIVGEKEEHEGQAQIDGINKMESLKSPVAH